MNDVPPRRDAVKEKFTNVHQCSTGSPPIVLFFGGKKIPYYGKSVLFGDNFSTKTSEMGEIVFQSPLFEAFLFSKVHFFRYCYIHFGLYSNV